MWPAFKSSNLPPGTYTYTVCTHSDLEIMLVLVYTCMYIAHVRMYYMYANVFSLISVDVVTGKVF